MRSFACARLVGIIVVVMLGATWMENARPAASVHLHLMPVPAQMTAGEGKLVLDAGFGVALTGYYEPRLERAMSRFLYRLRRRTGVPLTDEFPSDPAKATLTVSCRGAGEEIQSVKADESYSLEVTASKARLDAPSPLGILRGLETFLQLVDMDGNSFYLPAVEIKDKPRFPWRGLMIDVCRHWEPIEVVERNLDAMSALKMNVLHWHLSDDQGFRAESRVFPKLQGLGSDGRFFTQEQIKEVVAYARDRGIRVVPEFDMPGHTTSWFVGYPELASAPGPYRIERKWGVFAPTMDPAKEEVYVFLDKLIGEMCALFPDEYFHIGGDEVEGSQWKNSPSIKAFEKKNNLKDNRDLQAYFNKRLLSILTRHDKKMIGWDEILHPDLPHNIIIQSWRGQKSLAEAARQGYTGILSAGYYLDLMYSAASHYQVDPLGDAAAGLNSEQQTRILGGESCMWGEYVTPDNIDMRIWPRNAAIAERLWSPASVNDVADMYRRLEYVSRDLDIDGLTLLSGRVRMLRRLAGDQPMEPVKVLSDILEPVKGYARGRARSYTSLTPLNRLVDATRPESDAARQFEAQVERALAEAGAGNKRFLPLRERLAQWKDNDAKLKPVMDGSFLLKEAAPISETVAALADAGLQAIDYLESGKVPSNEWKAAQSALLARAAKPQAELLIMIAPAVQKLVAAAARE